MLFSRFSHVSKGIHRSHITLSYGTMLQASRWRTPTSNTDKSCHTNYKLELLSTTKKCHVVCYVIRFQRAFCIRCTSFRGDHIATNVFSYHTYLSCRLLFFVFQRFYYDLNGKTIKFSTNMNGKIVSEMGPSYMDITNRYIKCFRIFKCQTVARRKIMTSIREKKHC